MKLSTTHLNAFFFSLLFATVLIATGCKGDDEKTLAEQLQGDWTVESFTEDGVESINSDINSFTMEYEEYRDNEGDFNWKITYFDGSSETITGEYQVDETDKELEISGNGFQFQLDVDLQGNDLELSGNLDGYAIIIKAERD